MPEKESTPLPPRATDPEALAKELEMELMLKRASWQQARARRGTWRALSILFLILIIAGALLAWLFLVPRLQQRRVEPAATETSR